MKLTADHKTTTLTAETPAEALELFKFYQGTLQVPAPAQERLPLPDAAPVKRKYTKRPVRKNKQWSDAELEVILACAYKDSCKKGEVSKLAKKLGRTNHAVSIKISQLRKSNKK